jgi:hypothetical protein
VWIGDLTEVGQGVTFLKRQKGGSTSALEHIWVFNVTGAGALGYITPFGDESPNHTIDAPAGRFFK